NTVAPKPAGNRKFRRGFEVMVFGPDAIAGNGSPKIGLREWSANSDAANVTICELYAQYEQGMKANPGKLPFFGCTCVNAIPSRNGTNYEPTFKLLAWVERSKIPEFDTTKADAGIAGDWQAPLSENPAAGVKQELNDEIPF